MIGSRTTYEQAVLFVHGIGDQEQGDTLVRWTDALAGWLTDWSARTDEKTKVTISDVVLHPAEGPAHGELHLVSGDQTAHWLVEEVWWAGELRTPSYAQLAGFTIRALPITLFGFVGGAIRRHWLSAKQAGWGRRIVHAARLALAALVGLPLALLAAPLVAALVVLLLVVGLVPIPAIRSRVLGIQRALTLTVGDSLILLSSPTQRAAMTSRVIEAIRFAKARGVSRITIVAHSQGAAVVKHALSGDEPFVHRPRLVTVGSGINRLEELEQHSKAETWLAPAFLAGTALFGWWLWALESAGEISWAGIAGWAAGYVGVVFLVSSLAVLGPRVLGRRSKLIPWALTAVLAAFIVVAVVTAGDAFFALMVSFAGLVLGYAGLQKLVFRRPVLVSPRLERKLDSWLDLYSNADPVPNGPTLTGKPGWPESVEVANVDSLVADHVRYERSRDDALALIAEFALRGTAGPVQVTEEDRERIDQARTRRRGRLGVLRATRWITAIAAAGFLLRWPDDIEASGRDAYEWTVRNIGIPTWWPDTVGDDTAHALGIAGVVVIAGAVYLALARLWGLWNSIEAGALFARPDRPAGSNAGHAALTALAAGWVVALYATLVLDDWTALGDGLSAVDWFESLATFGFLVFATALVVAGMIGARGGRLSLRRSQDADDTPEDEADDGAGQAEEAAADEGASPSAPGSAVPLQRSADDADPAYTGLPR